MPLLSTMRALHVVCPRDIPPQLGNLSNLETLELYPANYDLSGCAPSSLEDQMRSAADTDIGILSYC